MEDRYTVVGLCEAAEAGDVDAVMRAIEAEPELMWSTHPELTRRNMPVRAIHRAAVEGHADVVYFLLEKGDDPIGEFFHNYRVPSALSLARQAGHVAVVSVIEDHFRRLFEADPDAVHRTIGEWENTVVHLAVYHQHLPLVTLALDHGADINRRNARGIRPIHLALYDGMGGPGPMLRDADLLMGGALLARGAERDIWVSSAIGDVGRVEELLNEDPSLIDFDNGSNRGPSAANRPLAIAVHGGHIETVRVLLDHGADPDCEIDISDRIFDASDRPEWGIPLIWAIARKHFDIAHLLIDRGARVGPEARPSIMGVALRSGDEALQTRIVVRGGRPEQMHYVKTKNYLMIGELLDRIPDALREFFFPAVRACDPNIVEMCLAHKPELPDGLGVWPKDGKIGSVGLFNHIARYAFGLNGRPMEEWDNCRKVMRQLLDYGANPNDASKDGQTGLHNLSAAQEAIMLANEAVLADLGALLLDYGADVNRVAHESQMTPLGTAVKYNRLKLVRLFLDRGADPNAPSDSAETQPLAIAESLGYRESAEMLLEAGATKGES